MESSTFTLRSTASYRKLVTALNDTMFTFVRFDPLKVRVWGKAACNEVRQAMTTMGWEFSEQEHS